MSRDIALFEDIIPEHALRHIPFSREAFSQWNERVDLLSFLSALHDKRGIIIDALGVERPVSYEFYGQVVYDRGVENVRTWIRKFFDAARAVRAPPASVTPTPEIPDFSDDPYFGEAAKYLIAWDGVEGEALSESAFFSISHLLESTSDIECSLLLCEQLYYKQALQILRNFIEDLVLPIYFCDRPGEFAAWRTDAYYVPNMRGKYGMLTKLVERRILSEELANEASTLYGDLNWSVHGRESRMIHRGIHSGRYVGPIFKYGDFREWCEYVCRCVTLGIRLLRVNLIQWGNVSNGRVMCNICHNEVGFEIEEIIFGGETLRNYRCPRCGHEMMRTEH